MSQQVGGFVGVRQTEQTDGVFSQAAGHLEGDEQPQPLSCEEPVDLALGQPAGAGELGLAAEVVQLACTRGVWAMSAAL